jgi:signal transduction histidine kinase
MTPMALRLKERALTLAVIATTIVVILVAVLQFRSNTDVTEATGVRLADTLQMSMVNWQLDLTRNIEEVARSFRLGSETDWSDPSRLVARLDEWRTISRYPDLVKDIRLIDSSTHPPRTLRLNVAAQRFEPATGQQPRSNGLGPELAWHFDPTTPSLLRALDIGILQTRLAVIELDAAVIRNRVLPDLAHRYFQGTDGLDYEVAVVAGRAPRRVLYASDPGFGSQAVDDADGVLNVFGRPLDGSTSPIRVFHKTAALAGPGLLSISWLPVIDSTAEGQDWELVVRHRRGGPLGAFVANTYRRDLLFSSAALLLLVISIAVLVVASSRAQKLAALQMDFVTTVSHELRTPLTVISSAADNITHGVVQGSEQVKRYGGVIGNQARQLSALVEQILLFATHGRNPQQFDLRPLSVPEILDTTLASMAHLIEAARFKVERSVPDGLPNVQGDLVAVSQCLQNFIANALKYGGDQRWFELSARAATGTSGPEVQIAVSDGGIGIAPGEVTRIFEPFYRSLRATRAQIHGTGLGLSVAKELAAAMGGRISVQSDIGRGSTFVLHLREAAGHPTSHKP